jgi:CheY-like chemotaxis protein
MGAEAVREIRVLVIDDDEDEFILARSRLNQVKRTRYSTEWAPTPEKGIAALRDRRHDVCLLDYRLGEMTGVDVLTALGGDLRTVPPIIMLTGTNELEVDLAASEAGATDFLEKQTVTAKELERAIRYAMQRRRIERELLRAKDELEQQNLTLTASYRRLEELADTSMSLLQKLSRLEERHIRPLEAMITEIRDRGAMVSKERLKEVEVRLSETTEILRPITAASRSHEAMRSKRVLLAESDRRHQIHARMALRGTGVEIDVVSDEGAGRDLLGKRNYDLMFVDHAMIELAAYARQVDPNVIPIFLTSERLANYLKVLRQYPYIANIISRNDEDRTFTQKNIIVTVSKLLGKDFFGMEKYLSWGVEIQTRPIVGSKERLALLNEMENYFKVAGIRATMISKAALIAEELLTNAIYDAPRDTSGKVLYNHLPRTVPVSLPPAQQGSFRYGGDGSLIAISVSDPFGGLDRGTIFNYLESCYSGQPGSLQGPDKGGAGVGLYQIMEMSALVVINVRKSVRTEIIVLLHVDPEHRARNLQTSFHYFSQ